FRNIKVKGFGSAMLAVLVIGALNTFLGPILQFLGFPLTLLTLGLFALVINAFLFWAAAAMLSGFDVEGPFSAFFGSIVYSIISALLTILVFMPAATPAPR